MTRSTLHSLGENIQRIAYCGNHVDLVATSQGIVRVGSMPDIAKFTLEHGFREEIVVVPDWEVSLAGDNRTGEEFVLWHAQMHGSVQKKYVGLPGNVASLEHQLGRIFPYYFDENRLSIVRKRWLENWFQANPVESSFREGELEIGCGDGNIRILDGGNILYDRQEHSADKLGGMVDTEIEAMLATIPRDRARRDCLEIIPIGCGNGFDGIAASTIVRFDKYVIWIDPCGYPAQTLAQYKVHWDDITHYLFTHNHEDHIQGLTACLARARKSGKCLNFLVADRVFRLIKELYSPLFPDLKELVRVASLVPGKPFQLGPVQIESRWNHHILPYGTLGLRITAGGKCFGYSGDTKYDETINTILKREELTASWFAPCDLVFHEVEFHNPQSVHTHWKQLQLLQQRISGKIYGYHTPFLNNSPFDLARQGKHYFLGEELVIE